MIFGQTFKKGHNFTFVLVVEKAVFKGLKTQIHDEIIVAEVYAK